MEIKVDISDEQLLKLSANMQAALPDVLATNAQALVARLLSEEGADEEQRAAEARFARTYSSSWEVRDKTSNYMTFRKAVIARMAEKAIEAWKTDPAVEKDIADMKAWFVANRREVTAEAFAAWFDRVLTGLSDTSLKQWNGFHQLTDMLKHRGSLSESDASCIKSVVQ